MKAAYFEKKVLVGRGKNGAYLAFSTVAEAVAVFGDVQCPRCAGGSARATEALRAAPRSPQRMPALSKTSDDKPNYIVKRGDKGARVVEAWSQLRLNFLPKDWRACFRAELEAAVSALQADDGEHLLATYISRERGNFDTENILFFNVDVEGTPFANCAGNGVRFERGFGDPPAVDSADRFPHYHCYEVGTPGEARLWCKRKQLATWERQPCGTPGTWKRAARVWRWMKRAKLLSIGEHREPPKEFGLRVVLQGPPGFLNVLSVIKPLLDGIVAAFQADDETSPETGLELHAQNSGLPVEEATALLRDTTRAILGCTRLLRSDGLMQPGDHGCVVGEVLRVENAGLEWACSGEVFEVRER